MLFWFENVELFYELLEKLLSPLSRTPKQHSNFDYEQKNQIN